MAATRSAETDIRVAIVRAATRLFAAKGFDGTALQEIADAVGVTKPAVLHHFPSKEHIRQAVLGEVLEHWQATLPRLLLAASAGKGRFEAVFGELYRFFASDADRARVILRECLDRPAEARKLLVGPVRPWLDAVAGYIRAGQAGGRHHADLDPDAYVINILCTVISLTATASVNVAGLGEDGRARYDREMARIARSSLFIPESTQPLEHPQPPLAAPEPSRLRPATTAKRRKGTRKSV
ncbi:Transcriptional regulator, TetR family protein [Minicystis rosea]|nr:Transcriptional regulator, TetR family protein [Minicystis rosea]